MGLIERTSKNDFSVYLNVHHIFKSYIHTYIHT